MTIAVGEFIASLLIAFVFGGVFAVILWGGRMQTVVDDAKRNELRRENAAYSRGCTATRASLRDALTTLPRLRCSRSISGHVRLADVERLLVDGSDG